jgi:hypothetical protein
MKSERRHELQHNDFAEWIFKTGEQLKPHQNLIFALVALVAVAFVGYAWWARNTASRVDRAWASLSVAMDRGDIDLVSAVAEENANTVVGQTAAVVAGDWRLATACNQRFTSATMARRDLKAAQDSYAKVLETSTSEMLLERATYGMARANETDGKLDSAKRRYNEVANRWPHGAFAEAARRRLADFEVPDTKQMFASLKTFEPKGEFSEDLGAGGSPSSPPTFDLPKEPQISNGSNDIGGDMLKEPGKSSATGPSKAGAEKKTAVESKTPEKPANTKKSDAAPKKKP